MAFVANSLNSCWQQAEWSGAKWETESVRRKTPTVAIKLLTVVNENKTY